MRKLFNKGLCVLLLLVTGLLEGSSSAVVAGGSDLPPTGGSAEAGALPAGCSYALGTGGTFFSASGGAGSVDLTTGDACGWNVVSSNYWIRISSATNGAGSSTVSYTVTPNPTVIPRTGWLSIGDQLLTVNQGGILCAYSLDPTGRVHSYPAEFATFNVTAPTGCDWTVVNTNEDWMAIKLYTNGTGNGIVRYSVFANDNPVTRSGSVTVNGQPFTITQLPAPCTYSLLPTNCLVGSTATAGGVTVFTADGCPWTASNTNSWISIAPTNGSGGSVVNYVVAPNYTTAQRTGVVTIAGMRFTATQLGTSCKYSLSLTNRAHGSGAATGTVSVATTTSCPWSVGTSNDWVTIYPSTNGLGNRSVTYSILANPSSLTRTGSLLIANQIFRISQAGVPCSYTVTPASRAHGPGMESNVIGVVTPPDCQWVAQTTNSWITLTSNTNGPSSRVTSYQVAFNPGPARTGVVSVGPARFTITQGVAIPPQITSGAASQGVLAGATVVFEVTASGTPPLNFQWQFNGSNLVDGPMVNGATTARLTLPSVQSSQAGNYSVIVSNLRSAVTSASPAVLTVNTAPVLAPIGNRTVSVGAALALRAVAADLDVPAQTLTFSLDTGAPAGASINPVTGIFSWTPTAAQVSKSYPVTVRVSDSGSPVASVSETITITVTNATAVNTVNTAPVMAAIGNKNVIGGNLLTFTVSATDADLPAQVLTYSLDAGGPPGATIGPGTGVFSWTPAKTQVSGAYPVTIRVTDNGTPALSAIQTISITLSQTNSAPVLAPLGERTVVRGDLLTFTAIATDADFPPQTLTYSLGAGAPSGATINPTNGVFTWTSATNTPAPSTNTVTIRVTDNGSPPLSDAKSFSITVIPTFSSNLTLIAAGSVWKYRDTGEDLGTAWAGLAFNDSAWSNGPALLGYAGGGEATVVSYGPNASAKYITTYFRRTIAVAAPSTLSPLNLGVRRDDGVVVYINGSEVYRDNMPTGSINYLTPAATSVSGTNKTDFHVSPPVSASYLVPGNNVVAAEVHQRSGSSSSMDFDLALTATTVRPANTVPVLAPIGNKTIDEGSLLTFTVSATDADLPAQSLTFSLDAGAPAAARIDPATGVFTWTPAEADGPAAYAVTIRVTDNGSPAASASETLRITVNEVNVPPVLAALSNKTIDEGTLLTFTASATDADLPAQTLTFSLDAGAPAAARIDPVTGVFTWTPAEEDGPAAYAVAIRVTDSGSPPRSAFGIIRVTVNEVNVPPVLAPIGNKTIDEGNLLTFTVSAIDPDLPAQTLTYTLDVGAPAAARIDPATGVFTWTPAEEDGPAAYAVTIRVTDNGSPAASASETIRITVNEVNVPPVLAALSNKTIDEGSLLTFTVSATDADLPAQTLTFSLDGVPPRAARIDPVTGVFTWTPVEEDGPAPYAVAIRVTDNGSPPLSAFALIRVTVNEVNVPPVLTSIGNKTIDEGSLLTFTVSATDADVPAQPLTYTLDAGAPTAARIDPTTGVFTWTPAKGDGPAPYAVAIRVSDNGSPPLSAYEIIRITVNAPNTAPVLTAIGNQTANNGSLLMFTAAASDADLPPQALTYSLGPGAPPGAAISPSSGLFAWTPAITQSPGSYPVSIRVTDNGTPPMSATQIVIIALSRGNPAPVLSPIGDRTVTETTLLTFTASASDPDSPAQALAFSLDTGAPAGASINSSNGVFTWTPTEAQGPGTNTVTIRVTDNGSPAASDFETIRITVLESNSPPILAKVGDQAVVKGNLLSFNLAATDADLPAQVLTYSLAGGAPSGASLNPTNGLFTWVPGTTTPAPGTNTVTVRVTDNGSPPLSDTKTFTITVVPGSSTNLSLIPAGSVWKYRDTGEDLGTAWNALGYNDGAWSSGPAMLGYLGGGEATVVSYGPDATNKYITTYFRRTITINNLTGLSPLNLSVRRDDGVVVYINGTEVFRDNMPSGSFNYLTLAPLSVSGTNKTSFHVSPPVDPGLLIPGENVVAVEVHQHIPSSTSMDFDLALTATLVKAANTPPVLRPIGSKVVSTGSPLSFTASASDVDVPAQTLLYTLDAGGPAGATIQSTTGLFSWTPSGAQTVGSNNVTVRVTDNGVPPLSASETIAIVVSGPGTLALVVGSTNGPPGTEVTVPLQASGFTNLSSLQFSLHWDASAAVFVDVEQQGLAGINFGITRTNDGILTVSWDDQAAGSQSLADGTPVFAVRFQLIGATAASAIWIDGTPTLLEAADADYHSVLVAPFPGQITKDNATPGGIPRPDGTNGSPPVVSISLDSHGGVSLQWTASPGTTYRVQSTTNLSANVWTNLAGDVLATGSTASATDAPSASPQRFYRVMPLNN